MTDLWALEDIVRNKCAGADLVTDLIRTDLAGIGVYVYTKTKGPWLASFTISLFPGNPKILIFSGVRVSAEHRRQGLGRKFLRLREKIAQEFKASVLLCTVHTGNVAEENLLTSEAWHPLSPDLDGFRIWRKRL